MPIPHTPSRHIGTNSLIQLDSILNKFSASLKTIELSLDSLEVNKFTENADAEKIWLSKFELLKNDFISQIEIHALINEKCETYLASLDNEEDALHFAQKIDQINYRWNSIKMRLIALRHYVQSEHEQSKKLLFSIRELVDWMTECKAQLNDVHILAGDVVTAAKQKNDHRIFCDKIEEKRPFVENALLAGRHFLAIEGSLDSDGKFIVLKGRDGGDRFRLIDHDRLWSKVIIFLDSHNAFD